MSEELLSEQELVEEVQGLSPTDLDFLRRSAKNDLFVFAKGVLRYQDITPECHGAFCRFIQNRPEKRRLGLMPRAHLKSTIGTIADSARLGILDPNETRILIASETATQAEAFLSEIKGHFEKNELLRALFPEVLPDKFQGPGAHWTTQRAMLRRDSVYKEWTWSTIGVGGAITGFHFPRIKCDDLIGLAAYRSTTVMMSTIAWTSTIEPLLVDQNEDQIEWYGTRWRRKDLYNHLMDFYGGRLAVFSREAIEGGQIIFPRKHSWEEYSTLQTKNPALWFAQYCNNPLAAGQTDFPAHMIRNYRFNVDFNEVIFQDDQGKEKRWKTNQLDRVLIADPNSGAALAPDMAAISVSGISPDDEVFVLESLADRFSPSGFVDKIFEVGVKWNPRVVGIEKAGQQNTDYYFRLKSEKERRYFTLADPPLTPGNKESKPDRIRGSLEPILRSGRLYLLASQVELRQQIADFPDCILFDEVDALSYGPKLWRRPYRVEDLSSNRRAMRLVMMKTRNRRTGY